MNGSVSFTHDTSSTISSIREILSHYDQGFPLIKELIQNADDAGATRLDIGWLRSVSGLRNPLLQAPSLFVLNNGPFSASDESAILRISGSDKGNQEGAIGKFGRGLKSVFHLCEGFVFLSSVQAGGGDVVWPLASARLLTPWNPKEGLHPEWDLFDDAHSDVIRAALLPFLPAGEHWFCLWIPLRREDLGPLPPIHPGVFPGDSDVPPEFLREEADSGCQQTMQALPLLRSLSTVSYWLPGTDGTGALTPREVRLHEGHVRRQFVPGKTAPGEWPLQGQIVVDGSTSGGRQVLRSGTFAGQEVLLEAAGEFAALKERDEWPVRDVILGGKEKGEPHAAAVFLATPALNGGELRIANAVFLPVGGRPSPIECPGAQDIELMLHGYSFVNSNRTDIERRVATSSDPARALKADWNEALRSRGVLPALLPALDAFVKVARLEVAEAESLTRALSKGLQSEHESICRRHQWLMSLNREGGRQFRLLAKDVKYFELPATTADEGVPWAVFPALA